MFVLFDYFVTAELNKIYDYYKNKNRKPCNIELIAETYHPHTALFFQLVYKGDKICHTRNRNNNIKRFLLADRFYRLYEATTDFPNIYDINRS